MDQDAELRNAALESAALRPSLFLEAAGKGLVRKLLYRESEDRERDGGVSFSSDRFVAVPKLRLVRPFGPYLLRGIPHLSMSTSSLRRRRYLLMGQSVGS